MENVKNEFVAFPLEKKKLFLFAAIILSFHSAICVATM